MYFYLYVLFLYIDKLCYYRYFRFGSSISSTITDEAQNWPGILRDSVSHVLKYRSIKTNCEGVNRLWLKHWQRTEYTWHHWRSLRADERHFTAQSLCERLYLPLLFLIGKRRKTYDSNDIELTRKCVCMYLSFVKQKNFISYFFFFSSAPNLEQRLVSVCIFDSIRIERVSAQRSFSIPISHALTR